MWWRGRRDEDFHQEIEAHIALERDRLIAEGMNPEEAQAAARRTFGNVTRAREQYFESSRMIWLDHFGRDCRYALRSARRQPALSAAIVVTVALAVSANASLFAIFDGLLFRPLPYREADRIVAITPPVLLTGEPNWLDETQRRIVGVETSPLFSETAYATFGSSAQIFEDGSEAASEWGLHSTRVKPSLFPLMGVEAVLGRVLSEQDGGVWPQPAVISYQLWQSLFAGDPSVIGQIVDVPGANETRRPHLVGVMPSAFTFPPGTNVWTVVSPRALVASNLARLAPDVTLAQVRSAFPRWTVKPLREHVRPRGAAAAAVLLTATGLLLLVAWVQVAALLAARSAERTTEIGIRLALGATRGQLARQFGAEGVLIAGVSLVLAWAAAPTLTAFIVRLLPIEMTVGQMVTPDRRTFAFAGAMSSIGILIMGLSAVEVLRRSSPLSLLRGALFGRIHMNTRRTTTALLVGQLAVTTVLLYMAGLTFHSFVRVTNADFGFVPNGVVAFTLPPTTAGPGFYALRARFNETVETIKTVPGVVAVGAGGRSPFRLPSLGGSNVDLITSSAKPGATPIKVRRTLATVGYVEALSLRLREGRAPSDGERGRSALVNMTLARQLAQFGPVIGQQLATQYSGALVVGVVDDFVVTRPDEEPQPEVIIVSNEPILSNGMPTVVAKVRGEEEGSVAAIRRILEQIWPDHPTKLIIRLEEDAQRATSDYRGRSILLGLLVAMCLPLAIAGIAGALLHATRQQSREIGIHLALGAEASHIRRRIVGRALAFVAIGLGLGLLGGVGVGHWMSAYLFGISAVDPLSIVGVVFVLVAVAWASALWPAYRASAIDPSVVLRDA